MRFALGDIRARTRPVAQPVLLMLALAGAGPLAGHAADLGFTPNPGFVCDTLTVDVTIDAAVTDLRGFTFVFTFAPAAVRPIAVTAGALVEGASCPNFLQWINAAAIGDSIYVDGATLGCSIDGPGSIVQLTFVRTTYNATSPINCRSGSLRDAMNQPIPYTCHAGFLRTCPAIGVTSLPWQQVKKLYR
jgi:hypothetical protein